MARISKLDTIVKSSKSIYGLKIISSINKPARRRSILLLDYNDKELRKVEAFLKDNDYNGSKIYITADKEDIQKIIVTGEIHLVIIFNPDAPFYKNSMKITPQNSWGNMLYKYIVNIALSFGLKQPYIFMYRGDESAEEIKGAFQKILTKVL